MSSNATVDIGIVERHADRIQRFNDFYNETWEQSEDRVRQVLRVDLRVPKTTIDSGFDAIRQKKGLPQRYTVVVAPVAAQTPHVPQMLDYALDALRRGFYIAPCYPRTKVPAGDVVPNGVLDATNDEKQVREWWAKNPDYNYLIALEPSNLVVWDFDKVKPFPNMQDTLVVQTGRNAKDGIQGLQYYYKGSASTHSLRADGKAKLPGSNPDAWLRDSNGEFLLQEITDKNGKLKKVKIPNPENEPVGERRGRGAYVIGNGSIHPSGNRYTIINDVPLADSPELDEAKPIVSGPSVGNDEHNRVADIIEKGMDAAGIGFKPRFKDSGKEYKWYIECPWVTEHSDNGESSFTSTSCVILYEDGRIIYSCQKAHCDHRMWHANVPHDPDTYLRDYIEEQTGTPLSFGGLSLTQKPATEVAEETNESESNIALSDEEYEAEMKKEYPVIPLKPQPGPEWSDDIMYGIAGDIIRKASQACEAHPAGMYLDLVISLGSIIGRGPHFSIGDTKHFTNEFMCRVGASSDSRKGTGRAVVDNILRMVDGDWYRHRVKSGFGSAEAIVNEIRDSSVQSISSKSEASGFKSITVPGVDDKRLCVRENEMASVFQLVDKRDSRADVVLRDGWDSVRLQNIVKGKTKDGISNSAECSEPHLSISGDTTREELRKKLPNGAEDNGFGNRFLFVYVYRTKLCPNGGPALDWSTEIPRLHKIVNDAKGFDYVSMQRRAANYANRVYMKYTRPENRLQGLAGKMTSRGPAHIRRLALIFALLDGYDAIDVCHLQAAENLWDYCQESARYIFQGVTKEEDEMKQYLVKNGAQTAGQIRRGLYNDHKPSEWLKTRLTTLVRKPVSGVVQNGDKFEVKIR